MSIKETILAQKEERARCIKAILSSKSNKKIIIAGAGTGKTYTFKEILKANPGGNNIALTFINSLTNDMAHVLGELAEVKTFHAYCKKILHEQNGKVELFANLTQIIQEDANFLGLALYGFDKKFQLLDENSPEVEFYLKRGDCYDAVSFNDSVYRLYKELKEKTGILPTLNQILIDEYQDFNPLEVAFINELENNGKILIVGDDDQSVYDGRCASPVYLREKYSSGEYEIFDLPFCGRCPEVIVNTTNAFLVNAEQTGHLTGRISKRFECYIDRKGNDSARFPKIHTARCTTSPVVAKYIDDIVRNISADDIEESWYEGDEYYTVLVTGPRQYLTIIRKALTDKYPQIAYKYSEPPVIEVIDGYNTLLNNFESNLGWRIIIRFYLEPKHIRKIIKRSDAGEQFPDILSNDFIRDQKKVLDIIRSIKQGQDFNEDELRKYTGDYYEEIVRYYSMTEIEEKKPIDKTKPSILLSSFVGCKGLSAGHVIIVGANDGDIPRDPSSINDTEIAQFLVALTRTRKQCHIVSNKWLIAPVLKGVKQITYNNTRFLDWIPKEFIEDRGDLRARDI